MGRLCCLWVVTCWL